MPSPVSWRGDVRTMGTALGSAVSICHAPFLTGSLSLEWALHHSADVGDPRTPVPLVFSESEMMRLWRG